MFGPWVATGSDGNGDVPACAAKKNAGHEGVFWGMQVGDVEDDHHQYQYQVSSSIINVHKCS